MGTYLPSRTGSNYTTADPFFYKSQKVYSDFAKWMANVPPLRYTANYVAMGSVWTASLSKMFKGDLKTPADVIADVQTGYKQAVSQ
jgi:hypothetical protein